jgi:hypothetical protein
VDFKNGRLGNLLVFIFISLLILVGRGLTLARLTTRVLLGPALALLLLVPFALAIWFALPSVDLLSIMNTLDVTRAIVNVAWYTATRTPLWGKATQTERTRSRCDNFRRLRKPSNRQAH